MDSVLRAAAVYLILLAILRVAGKRTLAQVTVFAGASQGVAIVSCVGT